ncbi:possible Gram-negative pili assembly chaperone [Prochlorococcus marinus str. MIT 9515]|uniref:Possible Gram-negative pili assembly chaperone n=1 Tax=Prochlorococcus marinus (strain MIT 9515) TaxID=167542 RepID=A2BX06_PROM5|nr:PAP/fibrillin family protein [Prochlorococcus marinus]ABM72317.1 possible Gram-negative pili assembly chaperone [Prochlorococcus marinus str. MIT 9515]
MQDTDEVKKKIYQIAAITDRGQRLNKLISPIYQEKLEEMEALIKILECLNFEISEEKLSGEWELIYSTVELFRSSPFFLAIEKALNDEFKSNLFFKLHQLQVGSFGLSTIGRIAQNIDFNKKEFISTFDTIIFGLSTIPILGWFKLLPTFGGRVITLADDLNLKDNSLQMNLQKTKVSKVEGLNKIPIFSTLLMDRWYPVKGVWDKLPWNKESPSCEVSIIYLDEEMRIMKDIYGSIFIYVRPTISLLKS